MCNCIHEDSVFVSKGKGYKVGLANHPFNVSRLNFESKELESGIYNQTPYQKGICNWINWNDKFRYSFTDRIYWYSVGFSVFTNLEDAIDIFLLERHLHRGGIVKIAPVEWVRGRVHKEILIDGFSREIAIVEAWRQIGELFVPDVDKGKHYDKYGIKIKI